MGKFSAIQYWSTFWSWLLYFQYGSRVVAIADVVQEKLRKSRSGQDWAVWCGQQSSLLSACMLWSRTHSSIQLKKQRKVWSYLKISHTPYITGTINHLSTLRSRTLLVVGGSTENSCRYVGMALKPHRDSTAVEKYWVMMTRKLTVRKSTKTIKPLQLWIMSLNKSSRNYWRKTTKQQRKYQNMSRMYTFAQSEAVNRSFLHQKQLTENAKMAIEPVQQWQLARTRFVILKMKMNLIALFWILSSQRLTRKNSRVTKSFGYQTRFNLCSRKLL